MKIAVLSGKGGAGKTLVSVNLAAAAGDSVYIDCDVEEPNGRLFLQPEGVTSEEVDTALPVFDPEKCDGCRQCINFCRFHALAFVRKRPMVLREVCHSCGGCAMVCPRGAVSETLRPVGHVEQGKRGGLDVVTGVLDLGEASGVPVIKKALATGLGLHRETTVIDCPPGSACPVVESVGLADVCVLVAEPTAFGFHNFRMVHELAEVLHKPCAVVINKEDAPYPPLENYCREKHLPILLRIPYDPRIAGACAVGQLMTEKLPETAVWFRKLLAELGGIAP